MRAVGSTLIDRSISNAMLAPYSSRSSSRRRILPALPRISLAMVPHSSIACLRRRHGTALRSAQNIICAAPVADAQEKAALDQIGQVATGRLFRDIGL